MDLNLTYEELGERLGITRNAARVLAQRKKWHRYTSQDDGKARVRVPTEVIADLTHRRAPTRAGHVLPHEMMDVRPDGSGVPPIVPPDNRDSRLADMLGLLLDRVAADETARRDELERLRQDQERLAEERDRLRNDLQEARAEADHAKADQVRMAHDVAAMFDELRRLAEKHAAVLADQARQEEAATAVRALLEAERARVAEMGDLLDHARGRAERLEAEAHGARLDTAAASRMADEANRRAADLADRLTAAINEKVELLKAPEAERRRPWWRRLFKR
jgi:hypothetical protein